LANSPKTLFRITPVSIWTRVLAAPKSGARVDAKKLIGSGRRARVVPVLIESGNDPRSFILRFTLQLPTSNRALFRASVAHQQPRFVSRFSCPPATALCFVALLIRKPQGHFSGSALGFVVLLSGKPLTLFPEAL
jgi:hypothetical protein